MADVYFGGDLPAPREHGGRLPVALISPGSTGLALSTLGWQAVYRLLLSDPAVAVEQFHGPNPDKPDTLLSLEGGRPPADFPLLAYSIAFEEDLKDIVQSLPGAGVPIHVSERSSLPLVLAGGPMAFLNPAPMSGFIDIFFVGEAGNEFSALIHTLKDALMNDCSRDQCLDLVAGLPGVYVPGRSKVPVKRVSTRPGSVSSELCAGEHFRPDRDLIDPAYSCFVSPHAAFSDMFMVEVNRGCPYGCRFCAAGYVYRPPRHARAETLMQLIEKAAPRKVGLVGTALTDWPELLPFLEKLHAQKISFSLSSLRADGLTPELLALMRLNGVRTVTLALEAPSRRLRAAAGKKLKEDDFLRAVRLCAAFGVNHLKVYLITGWPGETDEDYAELESFLHAIDREREAGRTEAKLYGRKKSKKPMIVTLGSSCLTPKPFTPMQWAPMAGEKELAARHKQIAKMVKPLKGFNCSPDKPGPARLQGLIARGGEELHDLITAAARLGWRKALKQWDGDPAAILDREREPDEPFPWEVLDIGVTREHLFKEWQRYKEGISSPPCPAKGCAFCEGCGMEKELTSPPLAQSGKILHK